MTKEELLDRLNDIEWNDFEVKEASGGLSGSMWETVSAFSNDENNVTDSEKKVIEAIRENPQTSQAQIAE